MNEFMIEKILQVYTETISSDNPDLKYNVDIDKINHFNVFMKVGSIDAIHKVLGCNVCMLNCEWADDPAIMIIFSIPIVTKVGNKQMADRVMEIIENIEKTFVTVDYTNSREVKEDKFVYITIIKKIEKGSDE